MLELEYLKDKTGQLKAVVIPIKLWKELFLEDPDSIEELTEALENYALNQAMDEAKKTPLLNREDALAYLAA